MKQMPVFDDVHDVQQAFRKIVDAFAFPGKIVDLSEESSKLGIDTALNPAFFVLLAMLVDSETSSALVCMNGIREKEERLFSMLSYSERRPVAEADYIFVQAEPDRVSEIIDSAKAGDLIDPHRSATIVIAVEGIGGNGPGHSTEGSKLRPYCLRGPGIKNETIVFLDLAQDWLTKRNVRNREFPIGIDLLLVDGECRIVAIPRTTRVEEL